MINAREIRAASRGHRAQAQAAALVAGVADLGTPDDEVEPPQTPVRGLGADAPAITPVVIVPGMWRSMVNIKSPQLFDMELESMKKFILEYKRYAQKCPEALRRKMQHFLLKEHLDVIAENESPYTDPMKLKSQWVQVHSVGNNRGSH
jgi:hypothetical protein